jgi:hypothetical protein
LLSNKKTGKGSAHEVEASPKVGRQELCQAGSVNNKDI